MIWLPTVWNADSELIGSWKIRPISPPRIARISALVGVELDQVDVCARRRRRSRISPLTIRPGRSTMRRIERAVTLLPQPVSPTMPSVRPAEQVEATSVHRAHHALVREEVRLQIARPRGSVQP